MFRKIPGYDDYFINESGAILDKNNNLVKFSVNNDGQMYVLLNGKIQYVADLMARTYFNLYDSYKYPIHIDKDPLNNHIDNIRISNKPEGELEIPNRSHRKYSGSTNLYEVFNEDTGDIIECVGRGSVAELIQYEEISLKNMVGNGRKINLGPFKGYQIRRKIYN